MIDHSDDEICVECGQPCDGSVRNCHTEPLCLECGKELGYTKDEHDVSEPEEH